MFDIRLASRSLRKTPLVTAVAVLSLALGIGANAAIFSIFERMVLRPLPIEEPERLVNLAAPGPKSGSQSSSTAGDVDAVFSYPMFRDLERLEQTRTVFTGLAGHRDFGVNLAYGGHTLSAGGLLVSGSYFPVLGLEPALGRLLGPDDDTTSGAHPVVVLSHAYWRAAFDTDPAVLNQSLVVNGHPMTVVGVAPRGFRGTTLGLDPKVFVPISMREIMVPGWRGLDNRRSYWVYVFGRLEEGVSVAEAAATLNAPYRSILQEVELPLQEAMSEQDRERFANRTIALEPGPHGQSRMHDDTRVPLLLLLGVSGFVLLIACANVVNLLLTKGAGRSGEIAVRFSIGARRHHLVTQLLAESFLLALLGGAFGLLVAYATVRLVVSILPADASSVIGLDFGPPTWLFLGVLVLVTGLVGLFPALHGTRRGLVASLTNQSGRASGSRAASRLRAALATLQIAVSMALLVTAGLFTRSLYNVSRVDLGLDVEHLVTFGVSPELNGYTPDASRALFERLEDEIEALPGVTQVTASMVPLIAGSSWGAGVTVQGHPSGPGVDTHSNLNEVGPVFFRTLGIPLLAGREIERRDALGAPRVAVVNEAFARKFGLGRDAVGRRMANAIGDAVELDIEIVGLVADAKYSEVKGAAPPIFFLPYRQDESLGSIYFYVRSEGEPEPLLATLRGVVSRLDGDLPVEDLRTMAVQIRENVLLDRVLGTLSASFAVLATALATIGLYGVVAYAVAQRRREIGLRIALGADRTRVRRLVLRQVGIMVVPGVLVGIVAALGMGRVIGSLLYELESHDPVVIVVAAVLLSGVALAAGVDPAARAARIDPMQVLREE
jgi:predicted permease